MLCSLNFLQKMLKIPLLPNNFDNIENMSIFEAVQVHVDMAEENIKDTYNSIAAPSRGLFKDNGSRFIALAYPVETEAQIKEIVASLKKEYHDARHHCYAYRLGYKADVFRANDDGEPSGSAGRPILGQIDSRGLSDVRVVVVRYFGGIKLGIPGLIRAYKTSSEDALSQAAVVEKIAAVNYRVEFGYMAMNFVMKVLKDLKMEAGDQQFDMRCSAVV